MGDSSEMVLVTKSSSMNKFGASAAGSRTTAPTEADPYRYQLGFGNYFSTEAVYVLSIYNCEEGANRDFSPDILPEPGRNAPQRCTFDLYSEQLNGTPFVSYRDTLQHVWMYRIRPSVAHSRPRPMAPTPDVLIPLLN